MAADYSLTIDIDDTGLATLSSAGMQVALVWQADGLGVVAAMFEPMQTNTVTWPDSWNVYVSSAPLTPLGIVSINSNTSAVTGHLYTFDGSTFTATTADDSTVIQLQNDSPSQVTGGLANTLTVNGAAGPLAVTSAVAVPFNGLATLSPTNQVWLAALSGVEVGASVPQTYLIPQRVAKQSIVSMGALLLDFDTTPTQTASFDDTLNAFIPGPQASQVSGRRARATPTAVSCPPSGTRGLLRSATRSAETLSEDPK